jgi:hypothetical protein
MHGIARGQEKMHLARKSGVALPVQSWYEDTVGPRNSQDWKFPIGIAFGSRVFVCSNLAFAGGHIIRRKHAANS